MDEELEKKRIMKLGELERREELAVVEADGADARIDAGTNGVGHSAQNSIDNRN
jgi:hypothetical protein